MTKQKKPPASEPSGETRLDPESEASTAGNGAPRERPAEAASGRSSEKSGPSDPPVVGIGTSAGGLAALKEFFSHVSSDSDVAYVVVIHLSPEYESHLAELLQPHVKIPVAQVAQDMLLEPNRVYVIPPNANLSAIDTHLRLSDLELNRQERAPVDHFFRTLARTHDGHAIGVILTGSGSDGTLGLKEIKEMGGLTIVQSPSEAEYDSMPQSAISTGIVDLVLPLAEIPDAISRFVRTQPEVTVLDDGEDLNSNQHRLLQKVLAQLRARAGRDFSRYKRSTIMRRIARRMQINNVGKLEHYLELLREHPDEVRSLSDDLLITVTNFFRDREVFEKLKNDLLPGLFAGKKANDFIRVWSVGCATGEEAYSLAILLLEEASRHEDPPRLQVFASDLHEHSLQKARDAFYPGDITADVSEERIKRFFWRETGGYRVRSEVRDFVVFATHNLLMDPPFSKLDLIACRNVLIYLQHDVKPDVLRLFHYALRPNGLLMLGSAENIDGSDLFQTESKNLCLYRKRNVPNRDLQLPVFPFVKSRVRRNQDGASHPGEPMVYGEMHQLFVERYAPPSLLVSTDDKVVHLSERVGRYLTMSGGEPTLNVFKLVREELRIELREALHAAREKRTPAYSKSVRVHFNGEAGDVSVHVRPALESGQEGFALVIFEERESPSGPESPPDSRTPSDGVAMELETELTQTKQRLRAIIEEYETWQEEIRVSNEELQSANEELRSTMEELETSKEELQSINEELQTVNQENKHKVEELAQLTSDLQYLLAATDIATIFLDRDLRILRFTPRLDELFNVRHTDLDRPLADISHRLEYDEMLEDARQVLKSLEPVEREVKDEDGRWYLSRVLPYRRADERIAGVVIIFVDITGLKEMEEDLRKSKVYAESIIETLHEPLIVLSPDLRVRSANNAFYESFQVDPGETEDCLVYELGNGQFDIPRLRTLLEDVLPDSRVFVDYEVTHDFESIGQRVMLLNARRLDSVQLILLGIRDITEWKRAESELRDLTATLGARVELRTAQVRKLASRLTLAEQEERRRISQILHDNLQQLLYGVEMRLSLIDRRLQAAERPDLVAELDEARKWINQAVTTTRHLTVELSPPILQKEGLRDALEWLQSQMKEVHGQEIKLEAEHRWYIRNQEMGVLLFQMVRELLFNVRKHADTNEATVRLEDVDGHLAIHVIDNGGGFDVKTLETSEKAPLGYGLRNLKQRLELVGGTLEIESAPGEGTSVHIWTPVTAEESE